MVILFSSVNCLCLHHTYMYLSYMTDCYFVYVILPIGTL